MPGGVLFKFDLKEEAPIGVAEGGLVRNGGDLIVDGAMEIRFVHNAGMIRALALVSALAALAVLAGCGQKGPLKLPDPPKSATAAP